MDTGTRQFAAGEDPPAPTPLSATGARLIERARRGEAAALRELWQANRAWVAGILLAYKPRQADLEDLLQEVAMAMVRSIGSVRSPGAFRPWLRTVAINAARQEARHRSRRPDFKARSLQSLEGVGGQDDRVGVSSGEIDMTETRKREARELLSMVLDLPEAYREPVLLRSLKGMSYREISAITELPESTIETRIARGRRMLRERARQRRFGAAASSTHPQSSANQSDEHAIERPTS